MKDAIEGKESRKMKLKILMICLIVTLTATCISTASATWQPDLPSLYHTFGDYFMFGTFSAMSNYFSTNQETKGLTQQHYNSWSPSNEFKPQYQFGPSQSRNAYNAIVRSNYDNDEAYLAALDKANRTAVLAPISSQMTTFLNNVRTENARRAPADQIRIKAHTLVWHNMTDPSFFRNGFAASGNDWTSRDVMLDRLDSYIGQVFARYAPYQDIIFSWDVVNEAIDDFTGYIRNENDYQPSNWGRIFKAPAGMTGDDKLLYESEYVRKAFEFARKYERQLGLNWTLSYNDFFDSDKSYEPKRTATVKMLTPIYQAGNIDVFGMQGRNSTALSLDLFKETFNMYSTVCNEIQFTEADTRCDLEPNPDYDPNDIHANYYLPNGDVNSNWDRNNIHSPLLRVIPGWQAAWANQPVYQKKQADWLADYFDFLLENSKGNGGKIVLYAVDGLNDGNTFNSNKGCHIFMSADNAGNTANTAKMSYYAIIGSKARFELQKKLKLAPADACENLYTVNSWANYQATRSAAQAILNVRIYDLNGVNKVYTATAALNDAINGLLIEKPPVMKELASYTVNEGKQLNFTVSANDPNGDTLTYSISNMPAGAGLDPVTGKFSWIPDDLQVGSYNLQFTASNARQLTDSKMVLVVVNNANRPPVMEIIPDYTVNAGQSLSFNINASDPDSGDILTYSAVTLPSGASFDSTSRIFSWAPTVAGIYTAVFAVSDGQLSVSKTAKIIVNGADGNHAPVMSAIPSYMVKTGKLITFTVKAIDPDGDPLNYSVTDLPDGASFNAGTRIFSWTPTVAGTYTVLFTVSDGQLTDSKMATIIVQ
ncbi:MAG TPA: hypothetical protein DDW50_00890 [Firmicutes bacterium]|jgi:hypothetical protein|nr:hypothetical protein [Bacillota bacterium]